MTHCGSSGLGVSMKKRSELHFRLLARKRTINLLPENVIYFSYISGIPMVSAPEIDRQKAQPEAK